jgi:uncharacterized membrane protein YjfL (UPF0719 family)
MDTLAGLVPRAYAFLFALEVLLITFLAKKVDDWRTTKFDDDREIADAGNLAVGIRRAGLYLGGMIAMAGVLSGTSKGLVIDLLGILGFGMAAYAALFAARYVCHALILSGIDDDEECLKGNVAVGIVQLGIFIATGVLLNGALSGDDSDLWRGAQSFVLFFVLGQVVFLALAFAFQRLVPFDDRLELRRGNRSVAAELAGMFVAIAIILRSSLAGPAQGLWADVLGFLVSALLGSIVLFLFQLLIRRVFLHRADLARCLREDNLALALTLQALTIAFAIVIAATVA